MSMYAQYSQQSWLPTSSEAEIDNLNDVSTKIPEGFDVLNLNERLHGRLTFDVKASRL